MKLLFSGFEEAIEIDQQRVALLEVENKVLFSRICQSLLSELGETSLEPYSLWSDTDVKMKPVDSFLLVMNPFDLPWQHKALAGKLYARLEKILLEDEEARREIEGLCQQLSSRVLSLGFQLQSDYAFAIEWEMRKYLRSFGFGVDANIENRLLDNLIKFLALAADVSFDKVLVFVNIKAFLTEKELKEFYSQVVFFNLKVLLLESQNDVTRFEQERKMLIDQHFLEIQR